MLKKKTLLVEPVILPEINLGEVTPSAIVDEESKPTPDPSLENGGEIKVNDNIINEKINTEIVPEIKAEVVSDEKIVSSK